VYTTPNKMSIGQAFGPPIVQSLGIALMAAGILAFIHMSLNALNYRITGVRGPWSNTWD